jgi:uncharacterized protein
MAQKIHQSTRTERALPGGRQITLEFRLPDEPPVPATLLLPDREGAAPAALLIHGYSSRKEHMAESVGRALLARGMASLAIDLPLHGTRRDSVQAQSARNPLDLLRHWKAAMKETRLAIRYLRARPEVDRERLAVVGYSLGSFLAVLLAADEPSVRAVVVAAGGDLPTSTPFTALARTVADPLRAVKKLGGRPLLVVHGRRDRTVLPEQAERLFAAAGEPKEIRWWDAGHYLPQPAIEDAVGWLAERLG